MLNTGQRWSTLIFSFPLSYLQRTITDQQYCGFQEPYVGITENATAVIDSVVLAKSKQLMPFGAITVIDMGGDAMTELEDETRLEGQESFMNGCMRRRGDRFRHPRMHVKASQHPPLYPYPEVSPKNPSFRRHEESFAC